MALIHVGAALPLELVLHDGSATKFPSARVYDQAGVEVAGSPFALSHVAQGLYRNTAYVVTAANVKLRAVFIVYNEAGRTTESVFHTRASNQWDVETKVETVNAKLGTPGGASLSADIAANSAAIAANTNTLNTAATRLGTPAGASIAADIAAVKADTGVVRTDTAAVRADTTTLTTNLNATRVARIDNLDAAISSRATPANVTASASQVTTDVTTAVVAARTVVVTEIDQNQGIIEQVRTQLTGTEGTLLAKLDANRAQIDALKLDVGTIQNNTTARFIVPERMVKPESGTKRYEFHLRLFDTTGNPEAPDTTPTIRIRRIETGVDIVAGAAMTQDGDKVGAYFYQYTITSGTPEGPLLVEATVTENGVIRYIQSVTDTTSFDLGIGDLQESVDYLVGQVTSVQEGVNSGVFGLAALRTNQTAIVGEINQNEVLLNAVRARTDLIPDNPARAADLAPLATTQGMLALYNLLETKNAAIESAVSELLTVVRALPAAQPGQTAQALELAAARNAILGAIAALRIPPAPPTPSQIWSHGTRTLTAGVPLDAGQLATKTDLLKLALRQYSCRVMADLKNNGTLRILAWGEKDRQVVSDSINCRVELRRDDGSLFATFSQVTPNPHGVFVFERQAGIEADTAYYAVISMTMDSVVRTSKEPFHVNP